MSEPRKVYIVSYVTFTEYESSHEYPIAVCANLTLVYKMIKEHAQKNILGAVNDYADKSFVFDDRFTVSFVDPEYPKDEDGLQEHDGHYYAVRQVDFVEADKS